MDRLQGANTQWLSKTGVSKLWPVGQVWPVTCFYDKALREHNLAHPITWDTGLLHTASVEPRRKAETVTLDCTTQPSLFLFLTHTTSKLHRGKKKKKKNTSENPSFSPDLNLFPFPLPTINLKICPALPLLQISYFLRKCRAVVYLEADFRWGSRFFLLYFTFL